MKKDQTDRVSIMIDDDNKGLHEGYYLIGLRLYLSNCLVLSY